VSPVLARRCCAFRVRRNGPYISGRQKNVRTAIANTNIAVMYLKLALRFVGVVLCPSPSKTLCAGQCPSHNRS